MTLSLRTRNGWVDDGSPIRSSNRQDQCPNCGSSKYIETISLEECESCGLRCDYWGPGANTVYEDMMDRDHALQQAEKHQKEQDY